MSESTFCPHCSCVLSKKTYSAHRRLYYDEDTTQWVKKREVECDFDDQGNHDLCAFDETSSGTAGEHSVQDVLPPIIVDFILSDDEDTSFMDDDGHDDSSGSYVG